ncbi:MAG: hypothetical protein SF052_14925 [Bacteroidia bacterium]|nr:hypothetical protein [Bacteroidia bacterium]
MNNPFFFLVLLFVFSTDLRGQDIFVKSKAKTKVSAEGDWEISFIKIYTESGHGQIFLKNNGQMADSLEVWEVFPEPGGEVEIGSKGFFWGKARLGQVYVEIERVRNDADGFSGWRMFTRKDTVYLSELKTPTGEQNRYSASLFRRYHHLPRPSGEPFDINLLNFRQAEPGKNTFDIYESGKISDYPREFRILATLILMKALMAYLPWQKQR